VLFHSSPYRLKPGLHTPQPCLTMKYPGYKPPANDPDQ
jgi:hypothetical protein